VSLKGENMHHTLPHRRAEVRFFDGHRLHQPSLAMVDVLDGLPKLSNLVYDLGAVGNPDHIKTHIQLASMRQINAAIEHLHEWDYECAITLAGAAEGMLPKTNEPHFRQKLKALSASAEIKAEGGATDPNDYINWLKHGTLVKGGPRVESATITELEVIATIWRAITKFEAVYGDGVDDRTPQMLSFTNWARAHLQNAENSN
jgi:hypothetical protein